MKKSKIAYIETNDAGKPCGKLGFFLEELADGVGMDRLPWNYSGLTNQPGKGRRKVRITVSIEEVK